MKRATCDHGCDVGTHPTTRAASDALAAHYDEAHLGQMAEVRQMPSVDWHTQAMQGLLTLCRSGRPFVVSEVIELGVPDAPNPRTDWAKVTNEARDNGWMVPTGALGHSVRPTTKGSPATEWIGTAKARGAA